MTLIASRLAPPAPRTGGAEYPSAFLGASRDEAVRRDRCLLEHVKLALAACGYWPLKFVNVSMHDGLVIIHGRVPSFYLKQVAQSVAGRVPGVQEVHNKLEVA